MFDRLRYLLLQVRNPDDPMRHHEVDCFARTLRCDHSQVHVRDLLSGVPTPAELDRVDVVLLGGSGDYSVAEGGPWLPAALESMAELHDLAKPTFASCWGFQAMAAAMGGNVVTDLERAEVGSHELYLTSPGEADPVFGPLGPSFFGQMGHQDVVETLPPGATLLAYSDKTMNQAFRFDGKPIYCTQFHPELDAEGLLDRLRTYPKYIESVAGQTFDEFVGTLVDWPATSGILVRFVETVME